MGRQRCLYPFTHMPMSIPRIDNYMLAEDGVGCVCHEKVDTHD